MPGPAPPDPVEFGVAAGRLRLLTAPALLTPRTLPFLPERRFRLAVYLALNPPGATRDELATMFWPDRPQAAARSNLRKLILELRHLGLPALDIGTDRLRWHVASDALDLLQGRLPATPWTEPLPGLDGRDSAPFDDWLLAQRQRLEDAWRRQQLAAAQGGDPQAAVAAAQALLARDPDDGEARRHLARVRQLLTRSEDVHRPALGGRRHDDLAGDEPGLVGRAGALAELVALLGERRCRLLTLLGPGGVGKSALALAVLRHDALLDADALHWIALEDLQEASLVTLRVAREIGARVGVHGDGWDEVVASLHGRQELLVLDNGEHLPGLAALVERLLAALPQLRVLVTSRQRLGLADEWVMPLTALDDAAARRLFVAAARQAPARHPVDADDPALAALVDLLGGLPLALRLAAAWTRHLPLPTLLQQLRASMDLLQAGDAIDEHPAHHSLQATFERSWALLDQNLQGVLAALSVGAGSMRMDVALAVAAATPAQLATLADASLLEMEVSGRVKLHPLLRRFAWAKLSLDAAALTEARVRHAQKLADAMRPFDDFDQLDVADALAVIAPERQQLDQAWATALELHRADWLGDLASPLSNLVQSQGGLEAVLPMFKQAEQQLVELAQPAPSALCAVALELAALHFWRGALDECERSARLALPAARAARMHRQRRQALNTLAVVAMRRGQTERAASLLGQALAQARQQGSAREVAIYAGNLCGIQRELGDLAQALATGEEALQVHRQQGSAIGETAMLNDLALVAHFQGRLDDAFNLSQRSLQVTERHAMAVRRPTNLTHQASIRLDQGRLDEADALAAQALAEAQQAGVLRYHEAPLRRLLAELALRRGDERAAREQLRRACTHTSPLAESVTARGLLLSLAVLAAGAGEPRLAASLAQRAERNRPPRAGPLPRYRALIARLPTAPEPAPDDASLQQAIDRLLR
jgi:predicted ATPase